MDNYPEGWTAGKLEDFIYLQRGFDITESQSMPGSVPVISSSGLSYFHDVSKVDPPGVIIGRKGKLGGVYFVDVPYWPHDTTLWVKDFRDNHPQFVAVYLEFLRLERFDAATSVPTLNRNNVHSLTISLPPLPEQRKIAEILGTWDAAIGRVEQLIAALQRRKQGLMQRLLVPDKESGQPALRLPGFSIPWRITRFDEVFTRVTRKNTVGNLTVLTASGQHGLISQMDYFNRSVASESLEGYYLLKRGEFAYNRSSMNGYPYGAIKRLEEYDEGVLSTLYLCFGLTAEDCEERFYKHFFEAGGMNRGIYSIAQEGARNHGLLNVGVSDFFGLSVPVPTPDEQRRLADLFDVVEQEIDKTVAYRDKLAEQKKGLMQRLLTGQVRVTVADELHIASQSAWVS